MGVLKRDCPHCETKDMAFSSFAATKRKDFWVTALQCNGCHSGYVIELETQSVKGPHEYQGDIESNNYYKITAEYPREIEKSTPEYLPENIAKFYNQAMSALRRNDYDSSAMMSRKVLEVSVKNIHPDGKGSLYKRIETLANEGLITSDLKDWAHLIREDGNESAHEEVPVTQKFAESILSFTELFLLYIFTMPGMVSNRKPEKNEN